MLYRPKNRLIEATQWFKNGDHPADYAGDQEGLENMTVRTFSGEERKSKDWEGSIVRYFRHPEVKGDLICQNCQLPMHEHGYIDHDRGVDDGDFAVCPGDFIVTEGTRYLPIHVEQFKKTFEPADGHEEIRKWGEEKLKLTGGGL